MPRSSGDTYEYGQLRQADPRISSASASKSTEQACEDNGVTRMVGFIERTYRILYEFEDRFKDIPEEGVQLFTVLKTGVIENRKAVKSKKGKGLFGFGFPQVISMSDVAKVHDEWKNRKETMLRNTSKAQNDKERADALEKYAEAPGHTPETCPFIFERDDGNWAVVQVWSVNVDEKMRERFQIYEDNPTLANFEQQAIDETEKAMVKLFGKEAEDVKAKFAISTQKNPYPVYIGTGRALLQMLRESKETCDDMMITDVHAEEFIGTVVQTDWKTKEKTHSSKDFAMELDAQYALYIKTGGDKMPCVKPWELFEKESTLAAEDATTIPSVLLATPIPDEWIDLEVVDLFLEKPHKLGEGILETPKPLPINNCVGPCLKWVYYRTCFLWTQVILTSCVILYFGGRVNAQYSLIIFFATTVPFGIYCELQCVKYFIVPWVQQVHGCKLPLIGFSPFKTWLNSMLVASCFEMAVIQSNAIFAVDIWNFETHAKESKAQIGLWAITFNDSYFRPFPHLFGMTWETLTPAIMCLVAWLLSVAQLIALLVTVPDSCETYNKIDATVGYEGGINKRLWSTVANRIGNVTPCTFYYAFIAAAHACGMATVNGIVFSYPSARMHDELKMKRMHWEIAAVEQLQYVQVSAMRKLVIDLLLKKTLQLKLQVSLYAIQRALSTKLHAKGSDATGYDVIPFTATQILLTFSVGLVSQVDLVATSIRNFRDFRREVDHSRMTDQVHIMYNKARVLTVIIILIALLAIWINGYSMMNFVMVHTCKVSLWNFDGCAYGDDARLVTHKLKALTLGINVTNVDWGHGSNGDDHKLIFGASLQTT